MATKYMNNWRSQHDLTHTQRINCRLLLKKLFRAIHSISMNSNKILLVICFSVQALSSLAQVKFSIDGQYMNRAEYRHGYSTLAQPEQDAAFFISHRARIATRLKMERAEIYFSIQDVRTWGSTANSTIDNAGLLSVHEAWVALQLNKKLNLKMGRQEIAHDEDRIFGNLDWAMQARRHDAALLKFYDSASNTTLHFGFAFNQDKEQLAGTIYTVPNNYKTFQYLYFNHSFSKIKTSFLFLNNGVQYSKPNTTPLDYSTVFSQTFGPRLAYKEADRKVAWNAAFYYQTGRNIQNRLLSAYDFLGEVSYQLIRDISVTGGLEILSGTDEVSADVEHSKSFTPLYGTNHRFNGYMDYFYAGNHTNSVGLNDFYIKGLVSGPKVFYGIALHYFVAAADVMDDSATSPLEVASAKLGTEIDFTINYNISNGISIQGGYSQMFATKSLEYIKNVVDESNQANNWTYLMVMVRPGTAWPRTGLKF